MVGNCSFDHPGLGRKRYRFSFKKMLELYTSQLTISLRLTIVRATSSQREERGR